MRIFLGPNERVFIEGEIQNKQRSNDNLKLLWQGGHLYFQYWDDEKVAFLLGCCFTFEHALLSNNIPIRHIECNTPVYKTNIHVGKQQYLKGR
ncbi:D-glutamate cyclase family protein [Peribacillus butanolivorans]|uniref:D-glutamate cyclase family protein n=1 Tax=Peribacillus butanolivorans TaxID=421767 RepID=UPI0034C69AFD